MSLGLNIIPTPAVTRNSSSTGPCRQAINRIRSGRWCSCP